MKRAIAAVGGYTILEVMIVLVVTGGLFAGVAALFNGKQATTEFNQAMRDYEAKILSTASDVSSGFYKTGSFSCSAPGSGHVNFLAAPVSNAGTNRGCLFLGKVMTTGATSTSIFTVAGRQYQTDGVTDVKNLNQAVPWVVFSPVDITDTYTHKFGATIKNVYTISGNQPLGGLGFISQLGGGGAGNPDTGSRGVLLYGLHGTGSPNTNIASANVNLINDTTQLLAEPNGIRVCLWDGGTHRGEITVGDNGSQTGTEVTIDNGISAVCQNA